MVGDTDSVDLETAAAGPPFAGAAAAVGPPSTGGALPDPPAPAPNNHGKHVTALAEVDGLGFRRSNDMDCVVNLKKVRRAPPLPSSAVLLAQRNPTRLLCCAWLTNHPSRVSGLSRGRAFNSSLVLPVTRTSLLTRTCVRRLDWRNHRNPPPPAPLQRACL